MSKKLQMQYKAETGFLPFTRIEDVGNISDFPTQYHDGDDLVIPTPDYLEWLEKINF